MILSFPRGTSRKECKKFLEDYWVPQEYEFNTDTQLYEVAMRPFDKMKD